MDAHLYIAENYNFEGSDSPVFRTFTTLLEEGWEIQKQSFGATNEFSFSLLERDDRTVSLRSILNREMFLFSIDTPSGYKIFSGIIVIVSTESINPEIKRLDCVALGWEFLFDHSVFTYSYPLDVSQGDIIGGRDADPSDPNKEALKSCFEYASNNFVYDNTTRGFLPWTISRTNIEDGLANVTKRIYNQQNIRALLDKFSLESGYVWRVDSDKTVFYHKPNALVSDIILADESSLYPIDYHKVFPFEKLKRRVDISKLRNHIIIKGNTDVSESISSIEYSSILVTDLGFLSLNKAFVEYPGQNTPRVWFNGVEWTVGRNGIDRPEDFDVIWADFAVASTLRLSRNRLVELQAATGNSVLRVQGLVNEGVVYSDKDEPSIRDFGPKVRVINDPTITDKAEATIRAQAELFRLSKTVEVLRLSVLVDSTDSYNFNNRSYILRELDAGKLIRAISVQHEFDEFYLVDTYTIEHLGGEVYKLNLVLLSVDQDYDPAEQYPYELEDLYGF